MTSVLLVLVLAAGTVPLLRRDLQRADRRRRIRELMREALGKDALYQLNRLFRQVGERYREALMPVVRHMARVFGRLVPSLRAAGLIEEPHRWYYPGDPQPCACAQCVAHRALS